LRFWLWLYGVSGIGVLVGCPSTIGSIVPAVLSATRIWCDANVFLEECIPADSTDSAVGVTVTDFSHPLHEAFIHRF
jgi:hypothetical protein